MSKITFRADRALVDRVERLDGSKSEVMRDALRMYLAEHEPARDERDRERGAGSLEDLVAERVDERLAERRGTDGESARAIDLTISLEGVKGASVESAGVDPSDDGPVSDDVDLSDVQGASDAVASDDHESVTAPGEPADDAGARTCGQCGADVADGHVYCPNCGEKASRRAFCECGDELRSDWSFCPACGRRTAAAEVLDGG